MQERFSGTTKRKVSHFILSEEGRVGSKSAFTAAAVVSVASLATMLLGTVQKARADAWCVNGYCAMYCCALGCTPNWAPGCSGWLG